MRLTFRDYVEVSSTIAKLLKSELIDSYEDGLIIGGLDKPFTEMEKLFNKSQGIISAKYKKIAEKNISEKYPTGYLSLEEREASEVEFEKFLDTVCTVSFDFKPISEGTIKKLFKGISEIVEIEEEEGKMKKVITGKKLECLTSQELAKLDFLGLRVVEEKK